MQYDVWLLFVGTSEANAPDVGMCIDMSAAIISSCVCHCPVPGGEVHEMPAAEANADNDAGVFGRIGFWGAWAAGAALLGQSWLKARE